MSESGVVLCCSSAGVETDADAAAAAVIVEAVRVVRSQYTARSMIDETRSPFVGQADKQTNNATIWSKQQTEMRREEKYGRFIFKLNTHAGGAHKI